MSNQTNVQRFETKISKSWAKRKKKTVTGKTSKTRFNIMSLKYFIKFSALVTPRNMYKNKRFFLFVCFW